MPRREPPMTVSPTASPICGHSCRPTARWWNATRSLPGRLFTHAWAAVQRRKAARFRADLTRLIQKLSDILAADFARSDAGHSAEQSARRDRRAAGAGVRFRGDVAHAGQHFAALGAAGQPPRAHPLAAVGASVAALLSPAAAGRRAAAGAARLRLRVRQLQPGAGSLARAAAQAGGTGQGDDHRRAGGEGRVSRGAARRPVRRVRRQRLDTAELARVSGLPGAARRRHAGPGGVRPRPGCARDRLAAENSAADRRHPGAAGRRSGASLARAVPGAR